MLRRAARFVASAFARMDDEARHLGYAGARYRGHRIRGGRRRASCSAPPRGSACSVLRYFGRTGMNRAPLSEVRLDEAGTAGGAGAFFGFLASRLLRC